LCERETINLNGEHLIKNRRRTTVTGTEWGAKVYIVLLIVGYTLSDFSFLHGIIHWFINAGNGSENQNIKG
jgi:hypothetical protein